MSSATHCRIVGHQVDSLIKKTPHLLSQETSCQESFLLFDNVACMLAKCMLLILYCKNQGFFLPLKLVTSFVFKERLG